MKALKKESGWERQNRLYVEGCDEYCPDCFGVLNDYYQCTSCGFDARPTVKVDGKIFRKAKREFIQ